MYQVFVKTIYSVVGRRDGTVAVQIGLMLTVLIGLASLGSEIPYVLHKHRQLQTVADMAAVSAAATRYQGDNLVALREARAVAAAAGVINGQGGVTVQLLRPPTSGRYAGNDSAVQVVINQPQRLELAKVLGLTNFDLRTSAVALQGRLGDYCILALDLGAQASVNLENDAALPNSGCDVGSNSASSASLAMGSSSVIRGNTSVRGLVSRAANAVLSGSSNVENGPNIDDPYGTLPDTPALPCTGQSGVGAAGGTFNLTPGHFCVGWAFGANTTLNLAPGLYVIDKALSLGDNAKVTGTGGVTLLINGDYEMLTGSNAALSITAPKTGTYAGVAIMSRRTADASTDHKFGKTLSLNIQGALYFPHQIVELRTNLSASSGCTQVIARIVRVQNSVQLGSHCSGNGTRAITGAVASLVQ